MTKKEELHRALDEMSEEQLGRLLTLIEGEWLAAPIDRAETGKPTDLSRFHGILQLREDPAGYQERIRNEWT
jgi:hypothetical protein